MTTVAIAADYFPRYNSREIPNADPISARIERLKASFGLPAWLTGRKQPQTPPAPQRAYSGPTLREIATMPSAAVVKTIHKPEHAIIFDKPYVVNPKPVLTREQQVLAHIEISELAQPAKKTTKSQILKWAENQPTAFIVQDVQAAFPEIAPSGISSRVSELVKEGCLAIVGTGKTAKGKVVTSFSIPMEEAA